MNVVRRPERSQKRPGLFTRITEDTRKSKALFIIMGLLIIALLAVIIFMAMTEEPKAEVAQAGETISLRDSGLGQIWLPALPGVEKNSYDQNAFYQDGNYIAYDGSPRVAIRGIDISAHQQDVDWQAVRGDGIEFVMLRAGYRGYGNGSIVLDEYFHRNAAGALEAGLDVGVYFFSQATSVEEAEEEAAFTLETIKDYKIKYPVVFDWEVVSAENARTNAMDPDLLNDCAIAFCETVEDAGYKPMFYASQRLALFKYDLSQLTEYDFWLAEYNSTPRFFYNFQIWQYSESGIVSGVNGNTDLNLCFVKY